MDAITNNTVALLIQGGAVGLALVSLGIIWYAFRMMFNHLTTVSAHIGASNEVQRELVGAIRDLRGEIRHGNK